MNQFPKIVLIIILALFSFLANATRKPLDIYNGSEICSFFATASLKMKGPEIQRDIAVHLSPQIVLPGSLQLTSKGNGTMKIGNLLLRVFDIHDDGLIFKNNCLEIQLKDLNGDDVRDLNIRGIAMNTDEEKTQKSSEEKIELRYKYQVKQKEFLLIQSEHVELVDPK